MKITKEQREKENSDLNKKFKFVTIIGLIALCILA
jgi:hypothetical protein